MEIKKGQQFVCLTTSTSCAGKEVYTRGKVYVCREDGILNNNAGYSLKYNTKGKKEWFNKNFALLTGLHLEKGKAYKCIANLDLAISGLCLIEGHTYVAYDDNRIINSIGNKHELTPNFAVKYLTPVMPIILDEVKRKANILERANEIVNNRAEEKDRQYGPFSESMQRTADLFNLIRKPATPLKGEDIYWVMVCLKLSREGIVHKEDNLLDAVAYLGALNNLLESE